MSESKILFEDVFSRTKPVFKENKPFLTKVSIILSFIGLIVAIFQIFLPELYSLGNILPFINIIDIVVNVIFYVISIVIIVYLYNKIKKVDKNFSQSNQIVLSKLIVLILTSILFIIFIIPLYLLLIVPGIIFSILWTFYIYAVLFRDKKYYSALKYSQDLVSGKKMLLTKLTIRNFFKLWKFWAGSLAITVILSFIGGKIFLFSENIGILIILIGSAIGNILMYLFTYYNIIFLLQTFLEFEKKIGITSTPQTQAVTPSTPNTKELSQNEITSKNYIEQYKTQYSRESIKPQLVNTGIPADEVDTYLDKYF